MIIINYSCTQKHTGINLFSVKLILLHSLTECLQINTYNTCTPIYTHTYASVRQDTSLTMHTFAYQRMLFLRNRISNYLIKHVSLSIITTCISLKP